MSRRLIGAGIIIVSLMILFGLLFTWAWHVRAAAKRSNCQSNLHFFATQLYRPVTKKGEFPQGTVPNDELPPEQRLSWLIWVLPNENVTTTFDLKSGANHNRNRAAIDRRFRFFICPSTEESTLPLTYYVGIAGLGPDAATLPAGHPRAGVFGYDRQSSLDDIVDGTSNTIVVMETALNPGHWAFGGPLTVRGIETNGQYIGAGKQFGGNHSYRQSLPFGEIRHVTYVSMADGSVHTISSTIAPEVFEALATMAGKEPGPTEWWSQH